MNPTLIVFGSAITIVGMVLTYRLLVLIIDKRNGDDRDRTTHDYRRHKGAEDVNWQELAHRAESLSKRLANLEEILGSEAQSENEAPK
jgi:hypothetical protein